MTVTTVYVPNKKISKYKQKWTELKGETNNPQSQLLIFLHSSHKMILDQTKKSINTDMI